MDWLVINFLDVEISGCNSLCCHWKQYIARGEWKESSRPALSMGCCGRYDNTIHYDCLMCIDTLWNSLMIIILSIISVENPQHCDFSKLRQFLIRFVICQQIQYLLDGLLFHRHLPFTFLALTCKTWRMLPETFIMRTIGHVTLKSNSTDNHERERKWLTRVTLNLGFCLMLLLSRILLNYTINLVDQFPLQPATLSCFWAAVDCVHSFKCYTLCITIAEMIRKRPISYVSKIPLITSNL